MRVVTLALGSALLGTLFGLAMAYVEVRDTELSTPASEGAGSQEPGDATPEKSPRLEIDSTEYEFGRMQRGTSKSHDFVISNSGDAPLRLDVGQPTCKCTVGKLEKDLLQPGESVQLHVEWKASAAEGPFRQSVPITTNDPRNSRLQLTVIGEINQPTGLVPPLFSFDRIRVGEQEEAEVYLMAFLQDELHVASAEFADPEASQHFDVVVEPVDVEDLPSDKATAGVRIRVTAKPTLPMGRFVQWLALETNLPEAEQIEVPIEGHVVGDIFIRGRGWSEENGALLLGRVLSSEGKKVELNVIVRGAEAANVAIEVAEVDPPELQVTLGEAKRYKDELFHIPLKVEVPAGTRPMARLNPDIHEVGTITLKTTHPQAPKLKLDVRFSVE